MWHERVMRTQQSAGQRTLATTASMDISSLSMAPGKHLMLCHLSRHQFSC